MYTPPLPVALPLLVAAILAILNRHIPARAAAFAAIATSLAVAAAAILLIIDTRKESLLVYWFGAWTPTGGAAIGIGFVIDTVGATLVLMAAVLVTAALVFSSKYFDTVGTLYHALMLIFLGAMSGFGETGDLFNLFVFFELMSAASYALCGYKSEDPGPLEGALNFAITNTVGAFMVLFGIGLLYGRTGALNMAQIGRTLGGHPDAMVTTAFTLIACGFFVKAAIVPFHFWLADAHTVAPAPVCVLFSGIMVPLGLYAVVRVYWAVFSGVLGVHQDELRNLLAAFAAATALIGGLMCYAQRNVKRLLAFSTISHMGVALLGVALLTPEGFAGAAIYVVSHGMVKGGLFLAAGILLHRTATVDEIDLASRSARLPGTAALFVAGAVGLAAVPPFGLFWGDSRMSESAGRIGYSWMSWVSLAAAVLTSAAVLRFAGRAFAGWGVPEEQMGESGSKIPETQETGGGHDRTPAVMWCSAAALIALGIVPGLVSQFTTADEAAARQLEDRPAYAAMVLEGTKPHGQAKETEALKSKDFFRALGGILTAIVLAGLTLWAPWAGKFVGRTRALPIAVHALRGLHSGVVSDYVAWLMFGAAAFGAAAIVWLR